MFKFPLHTINTPTLDLLVSVLCLAAHWTETTIYKYLVVVLGSELARREAGATDEIDTLITLPLGESTGDEVIQAAGFMLTAVKSLDKTEPVVRFLDALFLEIESAAQRVASSVNN